MHGWNVDYRCAGNWAGERRETEELLVTGSLARSQLATPNDTLQPESTITDKLMIHRSRMR